MVSTPEDLLLWAANFEKPKLGGKKLIRQLETPATLSTGEAIPHASGLFAGKHRGLTTLSHSGSLPGFRSDFLRIPDQHLTIAALCNRGDADAALLTRQIAAIYLRGNFPNDIRPVAANVAIAPEMAGAWESKQGWIMTTAVEQEAVKVLVGGEEYVLKAANDRQFITDGSGVRLTLTRLESGELELSWEGDRPTRYRRIRGTVPSPEDLARYTGEFSNGDTAARWRMVVADGKLVLTSAAGWRLPLDAVGSDRLVVGPWSLQFVPSGSGQIESLRLHRARLWDLHFGKLP